MKSLGLGACLADDMGLGKTVQVIALLNYIRSKKHEKTLLVVPASLIGNWMSEIAKFAPSLRCYVIHPSENKHLDQKDSSSLEENDLFITTYGMLLKYDWLKNITWDSLILDEAQAIKNPGSKQTKIVKQLKASYKIAMTGTPIENRLSDLWSLFDFLNKGLLGSAKEFADFTKKLKENQAGYARLKQVVSPFILRRLKTDKTVISDLPEKIEMKSYATLTKKQVILYNKLVNDLKIKLESTEDGIDRKGLVLSSLMKFKQICNHPDQYLGQHYYAEEESGKYARLREICETIYEKRERVLIFTQFKEITDPLKDFLERVFQHKGLVLHGGTAVDKRKELVAKFQGQEYVLWSFLLKQAELALTLHRRTM
jgi:SNF2 family DNA or RNA helicase